MLRELSSEEITTVSGGLNLSGIEPSSNVSNQTLAGYQRYYGYALGTAMWGAMEMSLKATPVVRTQ